MLKIKEDIPLEELENYVFMDWGKEDAEVDYLMFIPLGSIIKREDIKIESFIEDLITAGIVVKE